MGQITLCHNLCVITKCRIELSVLSPNSFASYTLFSYFESLKICIFLDFPKSENCQHNNNTVQIMGGGNHSFLQIFLIYFFFQIHTRIVYLRHLIVSLAQARDIETTLLVFSHDVFIPECNELVQSVDFARTLQIFYPYSIQTHPNTFPGQSENDCPRDINYQQ